MLLLSMIKKSLDAKQVNISAIEAIRSMRTLHSSLVWLPNQRSPVKIMEAPNEIQSQIMKAISKIPL